MLRLLIVEDELVTLEYLSTCLSWDKIGVELIGTAKDGLDAIKLIEKFMPEIVITDLKMPNMDGLELINWCLQKNLDISFIVISGYDEFHMVKKVLKLGVKEYFLKAEIIPEEFERTVKNLATQINELKNISVDNGEQTKQTIDADLVTLVKNNLEKNFNKDITLNKIAYEYNINYSTLSRLFSKKIGRSFVSYLNDIRIREAIKLMKTTDFKLYEIADMVGYKNYEHFSRIFKKMHGKWPKKFE